MCKSRDYFRTGVIVRARWRAFATLVALAINNNKQEIYIHFNSLKSRSVRMNFFKTGVKIPFLNHQSIGTVIQYQ